MLLIRRRDEGTWIFPKGHVEGKETDKEAAIREVAEETGISGIKPSLYIGSIEYSFFLAGAQQKLPQKSPLFSFCMRGHAPRAS